MKEVVGIVTVARVIRVPSPFLDKALQLVACHFELKRRHQYASVHSLLHY